MTDSFMFSALLGVAIGYVVYDVVQWILERR